MTSFKDLAPIWRFVILCLATIGAGALVGAVVDLITVERAKARARQSAEARRNDKKTR